MSKEEMLNEILDFKPDFSAPWMGLESVSLRQLINQYCINNGGQNFHQYVDSFISQLENNIKQK